MWRALYAFVGLILLAGIYVVVTDPGSAHAASPPAPSSMDFGFALAAGAVALAATLMVSRPRMRFRR